MTEVSGNLSGYNGGPDALTEHLAESVLADLAEAKHAELDPELQGYVEEGTWGPMLRHPLVYCVPLFLPGHANKALAYKKRALDEAIEEGDWHTAVWLHERPYRFSALLDICIGRDDEGEIIPLVSLPEHWGLAAEVWIDSENIEQNIEEWRALFQEGVGLWLGNIIAFEALPDPIPAWRGGTVGDWSWTTDIKIAEFFAGRSGIAPRHALIPKADVFGYLTQRSESELLVRLTDERRPLVYPNEVRDG